MRKFLLLMALSACQASGPELVVVVHSDLSVPADFDALFAAVTHGEAPAEDAWSQVDLSGAAPLPLSFVVAPEGSAPTAIHVEARRQGAAVLQRRAMLDAPNEGTYFIPMFLAAACTTTSCRADETCSERGCVDPTDLQYRPVLPGSELEGLCTPGQKSCTEGGLAESRCTIFGDPPEVVPCSSGTRCAIETNTCMGNVGRGPWQVAIDKRGNGLGRVSATPGGIDCGPTCGAMVAEGATLRLTALPDSGSTVTSWTGCTPSGLTCSVEVHANLQIGVTFALEASPILTVTVGGTGTGNVSTVDHRIDCGGDCTEPYSPNSAVQLTAVAAPGSQFESWTGPCIGTGAVCGLTINGSMSVTARFRRDNVTPGTARYDLDNDGYSDLIVAAPRREVGTQPDSGRVYVVFGPAPPVMTSAEQASGRYETGDPGARFGEAIALSPDLNGDGQPDLVIGAPGVMGGRGAVYVIPGGPGLVRGTGMLPTNTFVFTGEAPGSGFGATLSVGGDLDKDGNRDLVVGAPGGQIQGGKVYVFFGGPTFIGRPASSATVVFSSLGPGNKFGAAIANLEDTNGDGADDLLIGAPDEASGAGKVYVFRGGPGIGSRTTDFADQTILGPIGGRFGASVAGVGDFLFDVHGDFAVGAPGTNNVFVFSGAAPDTFIDSASASRTFTGVGLFGAALSGGDDYDGDGVGDLVVGAPESGGPSYGRVAIFKGHTTTTEPDFTVGGNCASNQTCQSEGFGISVGPAGDQDGDGILDLAVGSRFGGGNAGPLNRGRVTVHHFGPGASSDQWSLDAYFEVLGEAQAQGGCGTVLGSQE